MEKDTAHREMRKKPPKIPEIMRIENITKTYNMGDVEVHALAGVSLSIKRGDFVAIVGPSGSGKTTMLNLIGCIDRPSKGKIFFENEDISTFSDSRLTSIRLRRIGFIFQQHQNIGSHCQGFLNYFPQEIVTHSDYGNFCVAGVFNL